MLSQHAIRKRKRSTRGSLTSQRPSAKELLKHQFLKRAKKTSYLVDLIERNQNWTEQPGRDVEANPNVEKRYIYAALKLICSLKATVYEPTWDFGSVKQELLRDFESSTDDRSNYKTCTESNSHSSSITPNLLSQCFSERDEVRLSDHQYLLSDPPS